MKSIVQEHALALKPIMVETSAGKCEMQVYECASGGLIALDGAFIEANDGETLYINSPWSDGKSIQLIDKMKEKLDFYVSGESHDEELINSVLTNIKEDVSMHDMTAIEELLHFVPEEVLRNYISQG